MKELSKEYQKSIEMLHRRMKELAATKARLRFHTQTSEKDPRIMELDRRLLDLGDLMKDLREVTGEIEHYFDKGWWRSEEYTLNETKPRRAL